MLCISERPEDICMQLISQLLALFIVHVRA